MRIGTYVHLYRTHRITTGVGKHAINMVRGLVERGQDVRVLAPARDLEQDGQIGPESMLAGMAVAPLPWTRWALERAWLLGGFPKVDRFLPGGVDWVYSPDETYVPTSKARFAATIHCVNWFDPEAPWYDYPDMRRLRMRMGVKWRRTLAKADVVLTVSHFLKRRITELFGTAAEKIVVVGNGVEQAYFDIAERDPAELRRFTDRPYVLAIGGLTARKGADCVLAVADALAARGSEVAIAVVGTSEPRFAERASGHRQIIQWGPRSLDDLPEMLRGSAALLFPSRYETFGIPAAEALVAGVPAIVSHYAGLPEIVGDAGLIMDTSRPDAIAARCEELARDAALREHYAQLGRARADSFRWHHCVDRLLAALSK